ncbi:AMP-binding protein [Dactylosporangium sp. CA-139114]|uniref:AMP-binding protein n=1 Tax=Dactylosporangium sp. CA-139114 TaxID=3239931 RepID=UPI003D97C2D3
MTPHPTWTAESTCAGGCEGLHEVVARIARTHPDSIALVFRGMHTTYAELDRAADGLAGALRAAGSCSGRFVPIRLPRSPDLVIALLAVLKTGAAYALLDPAWPERRVAEVLDELDAPLCLDEPALREAATFTGPAVRPAAVCSTDPCCVFFTSGTTGRPKGVVTPHRATARLFPAQGGFATFTARTMVPLAAPMPWDAFSLELWSALLSGGTSLILDEPYLSAEALRTAVGRGTDTVWLTSSLFNMVVDEDPGAFAGLSQVMIGGERLSPAHVRRFLAAHPAIALLNGYGPVESTVFATTHRIGAEDCDRPGGIPLGRPVPDTGVHILDGDRCCAAGEEGEICISGEGLALWYLNDPELTTEKFVWVPIDGVPTRVYRTGDRGERDADGLLHYRGRGDRQLKIRGHRVEPAEVERQIEALLPVRSARVLARPDATGTAQELLAFCTPLRPGDPLGEARAILDAALVAYQRPVAVVSVETFPVTVNGKLDERQLLARAPGPAAPAPAAPGDSPADPVTAEVAAAFAAVLGRPAVPADADFFDLGGTSLGAGRVCARLAAARGTPVPVSWLYAAATATALADRLREPEPAPPAGDPAGVGLELVPDEVPLTPMQTALLTRDVLDPGDRTGLCLLTWLIEGDLDVGALDGAIQAVHGRHEALQAAYELDPRPAAVLVDMPPPPLEILPARPSVEAATQAMITELNTGLEPMKAEVWRTVLIPIGSGGPGGPGGRALFGCAVHHVAFDGWSESVLARDLATAYNDEALPPRPPAPAPRPARPHMDALRRELAGTPVLHWPDGAPPAAATRVPGHLEADLDARALRAVDAAAASAGVSRFVVLLSHYARSLTAVTGQRDFAVGVPVSQRRGYGVEDAVGCHINMVAVRLREAGLTATDAAVRTAFTALDVPYDEVVRLAEPPAGNRPPLFQVLFALQDNAPARLDLAGLRTTFLRQPYQDLPLELHLELWPAGDGGLRAVVSYRRDAVTEPTARNVIRHFTELVAGGAA